MTRGYNLQKILSPIALLLVLPHIKWCGLAAQQQMKCCCLKLFNWILVHNFRYIFIFY